MENLIELVITKYNYWGCIVLLMIGIYAMIVKKNLVKKIIGMNIMQSSIILFYVSIGAKLKATIPILQDYSNKDSLYQAKDYINPLPHVLMLTAIVVSVATLGVALALAIKIYQQYRTLEEDEILSQIETQD
ncbi:MAG: cation:proton antiporter subunit C [Proteobacteria bacterium]|nr:cation:proton antiporter subunit C [Pseudomonadota bacterium]